MIVTSKGTERMMEGDGVGENEGLEGSCFLSDTWNISWGYAVCYTTEVRTQKLKRWSIYPWDPWRLDEDCCSAVKLRCCR